MAVLEEVPQALPARSGVDRRGREAWSGILVRYNLANVQQPVSLFCGNSTLRGGVPSTPFCRGMGWAVVRLVSLQPGLHKDRTA